jgi:hypothetical protein
MTNEFVTDQGYEHVGKGIYKFTVTLLRRGNYVFTITIQDSEGLYRPIKDSPFFLEVQPFEPSMYYSFVNGTGVDLVRGVFVGKVETINLYIKDVYDNFYNQTRF